MIKPLHLPTRPPVPLSTVRAAALAFIAVFVLLLSMPGLVNKARAAAPTVAAATLPLTECSLMVGVGAAQAPTAARCGTLSVPENRADPASRKINLAVVVLPALNPGATGLPIFHLEGGPGGSAITNFGQGWYVAYEGFRATHPVVLVDQRGTGKSTSLQCTEITQAALADLNMADTTDTANEAALKRYAACLTRLSKTTDPQHYTSVSSAADLDDVRAALGYDQILVFGNSYGTWLGQFYLKAFGQHVAGMVLDSVVGPWNKPDLEAPISGQEALDKVIALCVADTTCNSKYPNLPQKLETALARLQKQPLSVSATSTVSGKSYPMVMTADRLRQSIFLLLYGVSNAELIPQTITEAADGVYTFPASLQATEGELADDFISIGLNLSVTCAEATAFLTSAELEAKKTDTFLIGSADNYVKAGEAQMAACKAWRSAELDAGDVAPIKSDRPVLILSGELDPVTPVRFGEETQKRLTTSRLVTFPNQAHGVIITSQCARTITAAFLNNPTARLDVSCAKNELKPIFTGAYAAAFEPYDDPQASFSGYVPKGWAPTIDGPLTFFTSPDSLQFAAAGVYKNMDVKAAKAALLTAVQKRYGKAQVIQEITQSLLIISITAIAHSLDRPDYAYTATAYLRPDGKNVLVVWNAAPSPWFQAVSLAYAPQMLGTLRAR